jgi:neutral ceramidase
LPGEPFCQTVQADYAGYLPTEEQHSLGGYETWRAKSSFLEVAAARKIEQAALELLTELAK